MRYQQATRVIDKMKKATENQIFAYLVGLTVGDGHLESRSKRIVINSSREEYIRKISSLFAELQIPASCFFDKAANEWKLATRSAMLYDLFINKFGVIAGNKIIARMNLQIPVEDISYFLAGLYDAEGWHDLDKDKYLRIRLKINNQSVAEFVFESLKRLGFEVRRHQNKNSFVVDINKQAHTKRFVQEIPLLHPRWFKISKSLLVTAEAPNLLGYTRATMAGTMGCNSEKRS